MGVAAALHVGVLPRICPFVVNCSKWSAVMVVLKLAWRVVKIKASLPFGLQVVRQPTEAFAITAALDHAAHEDLNGADVVSQGGLVLASGLVETKGLTELGLRGGLGDVDLVAKHKEGDGLQIVGREQPVELPLGLRETVAVHAVNKENNGIHVGVVILPHLAGSGVATEIVGPESDAAQSQFLHRGVEGRVVDGKAVILEHVKKGSLSCIVEAQEKDLCAFVVETQERENTPEPIEEIHDAARKKKVECGDKAVEI
jgi:hypothetical protein